MLEDKYLETLVVKKVKIHIYLSDFNKIQCIPNTKKYTFSFIGQLT